eukprot:11161503-Alexandrium_andersonii.AAC.1
MGRSEGVRGQRGWHDGRKPTLPSPPWRTIWAPPRAERPYSVPPSTASAMRAERRRQQMSTRALSTRW